ncbi:hypothetical protein HGG76_27385 [Ochrobactrum tritici]|uniref:Uncharacterized protein n=1 Tax=Brucella tritici TaxID=94626 RepID=A0A7X6JBR7_9HYPH|nr:hypothetical protein [Brucella tritici]
MNMHINKVIYLRIREMFHATNGRMAANMGVSVETAREYGHPSKNRKPSIERLRMAVIGFGKEFTEIQEESGLPASMSKADLENFADGLLEKLKLAAA